MCLRVNQGIKISNNSIYNKLSLKSIDDKHKVNSLLDSSDISKINKTGKNPFQMDINILYNNEMEKLNATNGFRSFT